MIGRKASCRLAEALTPSSRISGCEISRSLADGRETLARSPFDYPARERRPDQGNQDGGQSRCESKGGRNFSDKAVITPNKK